MHFSLAQVISLVIGIVLPLLTGLITRQSAHPKVRATTLLVLSAATSFLTEFASALGAHQPFDFGSALLGVLGTFLVGVGSHVGLWGPTGASDAVKAIGGFIGGSKPATPAPVAPVVPPPVA